MGIGDPREALALERAEKEDGEMHLKKMKGEGGREVEPFTVCMGSIEGPQAGKLNGQWRKRVVGEKGELYRAWGDVCVSRPL